MADDGAAVQPNRTTDAANIAFGIPIANAFSSSALCEKFNEDAQSRS
jgi:hypothetical protein